MSRVLLNARNHVVRKYNPFTHRGVDVLKEENKVADVIAHSKGVVSEIVIGKKQNLKAKKVEKYGNFVKVRHDNGYFTLYAHLSDVCVHVGQSVSQGDVLGRMGNSGKTKQTCLHFEVKNRKDKKRNPVKYLDQDFLIKEDSKYLHYRGFICGENCWQDLVKEEEQYIGVFGYKLGGIFIETNIEDLQFRVYKNRKWSPFVSVNQEALLQEKEGIQGFQIKSNVKLLYRVHVLDSGWTDWFFSTLFYENVLEQENFIDGIQICVRKE